MIDSATFWTVTILLGIGTFLIRYSFLGFLGERGLPEWAMRHLRYVGVAVFPALVTPMILWPGGAPGIDGARILAAGLALAAGFRFGVVAALVAGMGGLWALHWLGL